AQRFARSGLDEHLRALTLIEARWADLAHDRGDAPTAGRWLKSALAHADDGTKPANQVAAAPAPGARQAGGRRRSRVQEPTALAPELPRAPRRQGPTPRRARPVGDAVTLACAVGPHYAMRMSQTRLHTCMLCEAVCGIEVETE